LAAEILVEIFIAMVLLSRVLKYRANRWANIAAGSFMSVVQFSALVFSSFTDAALYYAFFSVIAIATTVLIVWYAWKWREPAAQIELHAPELSVSRR
jgi:hypothetical protein